MKIIKRLIQGGSPMNKYGPWNKFHPNNSVGKDRQGNEYFEWTHPETNKVHREIMFECVEKNKEHIIWPGAAVGDMAELQLEWKAWLAFRREDPPNEEISHQLDRERAYRVKKAMEVEERERLEEVRQFGNVQSPSVEHMAHMQQGKEESLADMDNMTDEQVKHYNEALKKAKQRSPNYTPPHVDLESLQSEHGSHYPSEKLARGYRMDVHQSQLDRGKHTQSNTREDLREYSNTRTSKFLGVTPKRRVIKRRSPADQDEL